MKFHYLPLILCLAVDSVQSSSIDDVTASLVPLLDKASIVSESLGSWKMILIQRDGNFNFEIILTNY
jgi:hypothetical protein